MAASRDRAAAGAGAAGRARIALAPPKPRLQSSLQSSLQLSLQFGDPQHRQHLPRHKVRRWLLSALQVPAQLTVRIVGAEEARQLNNDYRSKDYATNVLTFDYQREPEVVADLVLCAPVVAAEAKDLRLPLQAHYAHLLLHGALHAQGYDHQTEPEAQQMEALETALLIRLGFADPYGSGFKPHTTSLA